MKTTGEKLVLSQFSTNCKYKSRDLLGFFMYRILWSFVVLLLKYLFMGFSLDRCKYCFQWHRCVAQWDLKKRPMVLAITSFPLESLLVVKRFKVSFHWNRFNLPARALTEFLHLLCLPMLSVATEFGLCIG